MLTDDERVDEGYITNVLERRALEADIDSSEIDAAYEDWLVETGQTDARVAGAVAPGEEWKRQLARTQAGGPAGSLDAYWHKMMPPGAVSRLTTLNTPEAPSPSGTSGTPDISTYKYPAQANDMSRAHRMSKEVIEGETLQEPIMDPLTAAVTAVGSAFMLAGKATAAGIPLLVHRMNQGAVSGLVAAASEMGIVGPVTHKLEEEHPELAPLFAIVTGLVVGMSVENMAEIGLSRAGVRIFQRLKTSADNFVGFGANPKEAAEAAYRELARKKPSDTLALTRELGGMAESRAKNLAEVQTKEAEDARKIAGETEKPPPAKTTEVVPAAPVAKKHLIWEGETPENVVRTPLIGRFKRAAASALTSLREIGENLQLGLSLDVRPRGIYASADPKTGRVVEKLDVVGQGVIAMGRGGTAAEFKGAMLEQVSELSELPSKDWTKLRKTSKRMFLQKSKKALKELATLKKKPLGEITEGTKFGLVGRSSKTALPEVERMMGLIKKGSFRLDWYHDAPDELRKFAGEDWEFVADLIAVFSPQKRVTPNINVALDLYLHFKANGKTMEAFEEFRAKNWDGVKYGMFLGDFVNPSGNMQGGAHMANLRRLLNGEQLSGAKITNFAKALRGDPNAVTVDTWMNQIVWGPKAGAPSESQNLFIQEWVRQLAHRVGEPPRDVQAALWVGAKMEAELLKATDPELRSVGAFISERAEALRASGLMIDIPTTEARKKRLGKIFVLSLVAADVLFGDVDEEGDELPMETHFNLALENLKEGALGAY